jgi:hypothetical protein
VEVERVEVGGSNKGICYCKMCSKAGYNKCTCKKDAVEVED